MELPEIAVIHNCFEKVVSKQKGCFGRVNKKKHLVNSDKLGDGLSQLTGISGICVSVAVNQK